MAWSIRYRFSVSHPLNSDETRLPLMIDGREATISSGNNGPLKRTNWLALNIHDFKSEKAARQFGESVGRALLAAGARRGIGIDLGGGKPSGGFGPVAIEEMAKKGVRLFYDSPGLHVYERQGNEQFSRLDAAMTVLANPQMFLDAVISTFDEASGLSEEESAALSLIGLSRLAQEPLAEAALCIAAVELISSEEPWTQAQLDLIGKLSDQASAAADLPRDQAEEVAKAISDGVFKSIRQKIKRKMFAIGMNQSDWDSFKAVYKLRGGIFHGGITSQDKHRELANSARDICARIVNDSINYAHAAKLANSPKN